MTTTATTNLSVLRVKSLDEIGAINHSVVVLPATSVQTAQLLSTLERIDIENPLAVKVLVGADLKIEDRVLIAKSSAHVFYSSNFDTDQFEDALKNALIEARRLLKDVEDTKARERSQKRKLTLTKRVDSLHKALMAVHNSSSVSELENGLFQALKSSHELSWVRIFLHVGDHIDNQLDRVQGQSLFKHPLLLGAQHLGKIVFARKSSQVFSKPEEEALIQISESVALTIDRIAKVDQAGSLKQQWESTFDAISEPLCVTDEKFNIIRTNRAFLQAANLKNSAAVGSNCFTVFGDELVTAANGNSSSSFIIKRTVRVNREKIARSYEVTTQRVPSPENDQPILLILFRDVTEQKRIEDRILESAKMAELGTIGSSIAHDINNPLGGMLSFLQLIKMDLAAADPLRVDILEMEAACLRCKEIVENLLLFSRRQETTAAETLDLRAAVKQALKIIELQTRSLGIEIEISEPETEVKFVGHFNLLSQALSHIFQTAFESVSKKLKSSPGYSGVISVSLKSSDKMTQISVRDNGAGVSHEHQNKISGISQTLAQQIITEHGGTLDISARPNVGTTAKISFINV